MVPQGESLTNTWPTDSSRQGKRRLLLGTKKSSVISRGLCQGQGSLSLRPMWSVSKVELRKDPMDLK